uniref:Uncharacterized protein n=1 Tax=Anopheles coluzzii TaxID=1518534 RepID=A0A8W7PGZ6_ANOCL
MVPAYSRPCPSTLPSLNRWSASSSPKSVNTLTIVAVSEQPSQLTSNSRVPLPTTNSPLRPFTGMTNEAYVLPSGVYRVVPVQCAAENADVVKALRLAVPVWSFAELEERPGQHINLYVRHRRRVKIE